MDWTTVILFAIGAFFILALLYLAVWTILARKMFRHHERFMGDDFFDDFDRKGRR